MRRNDIVMVSAGLNLGLDVVLNLICIRLLGVVGIALSTSVFYVGSFLFTAFTVRTLLSRAQQSSQIAVAALANNSCS